MTTTALGAAARKAAIPWGRMVNLRRNTRGRVEVSRRTEMASSLDDVLKHLKPIIAEAQHDEAMAALVLTEEDFTNPLTTFEIRVLACGLYKLAAAHAHFDYADVLELTDRFAGKAMNITMVYRTIAGLTQRGLIDRVGRLPDEDTKRPTQKFRVNTAGQEVFRLSVLTAQHLRNSRDSVAA